MASEPQTEKQLHAACAQYLDIVEAQHTDFFWFPVPNGTHSSPIHKRNMKSAGEMKPGIPDIMLIWRGRAFGVELKTEKGKLSEVQINIRIRMALAAVPSHTVRQLEDLTSLVTDIILGNTEAAAPRIKNAPN